MAKQTPCQTDGVIYGTWIQPKRIVVELILPFPLELSDDQERLLDANIHNALELVLAPYFVGRQG